MQTLKAATPNSMDTAPRDGTPIYLIDRVHGELHLGVWDLANGGNWRIICFRWKDDTFIGWVPKP